MELVMEKRLRVLFPADAPVRVTVAGLGGTGSALGLSLARLMVHARQKGMKIDAFFIDPDVVEAKNVGRQYFTPADIGRNKAEVMAEWMNADWGLDITAMPVDLKKVSPSSCGYYNNGINIIAGCVDNAKARRTINGIWEGWWLDCGNDRNNGQVLIGNKKKDIAVAPELGLALSLPSPSLQSPDLLDEPPAPAIALDDVSCADLTLLDEQSLNINQAMATYAAQYLYNIVIKRELTSFTTYVSLEPPTARSLLITERNLEPWLKKDEPKKKKRGGRKPKAAQE